MFEHLGKFRVIVVTGPQRSGTRITAKMIAHDTGYKFVDERKINIDSLYRFVEALNNDNTVIHCPALSSFVHHIGHYKDIAVVMVHRPVKDIIASQERIGWGDHFRMVELFRYGATEGRVAEVKYKAWRDQKRHILNAFDVNYKDLSGHPLWIPKSERVNFAPHQTEAVESA